MTGSSDDQGGGRPRSPGPVPVGRIRLDSQAPTTEASGAPAAGTAPPDEGTPAKMATRVESSPVIHVENWRPDQEGFSADQTIDPDCARLARQLKHSGRRQIGVLPASSATDTRPLIFQLALALSKLCRATIVIVDPDLRWPGDPTQTDEIAEALISADDPLFFNSRFIERSIALVSPREPAPTGARVDILKIMLQHLEVASTNFAMVLVDLSSFPWVGEFLVAIELLDGVLVAGKSGKTTEDDLLRHAELLPSDLDIGVLLID